MAQSAQSALWVCLFAIGLAWAGAQETATTKTVRLGNCATALHSGEALHIRNATIVMSQDFLVNIELLLCSQFRETIDRLTVFRVGRRPRPYPRDRMGRPPSAGPGSEKGQRSHYDNWSNPIAVRGRGDPEPTTVYYPDLNASLVCYSKRFEDIMVGWTRVDPRRWLAEVYEKAGQNEWTSEHYQEKGRTYHPAPMSQQLSSELCDDVDERVAAKLEADRKLKAEQQERLEVVRKQRAMARG